MGTYRTAFCYTTRQMYLLKIKAPITYQCVVHCEQQGHGTYRTAFCYTMRQKCLLNIKAPITYQCVVHCEQQGHGDLQDRFLLHDETKVST